MLFFASLTIFCSRRALARHDLQKSCATGNTVQPLSPSLVSPTTAFLVEEKSTFMNESCFDSWSSPTLVPGMTCHFVPSSVSGHDHSHNEPLFSIVGSMQSHLETCRRTSSNNKKSIFESPGPYATGQQKHHQILILQKAFQSVQQAGQQG